MVNKLQKAKHMWGGVYQCISRAVQFAGMLLRNYDRRTAPIRRAWIMIFWFANFWFLMISFSSACDAFPPQNSQDAGSETWGTVVQI